MPSMAVQDDLIMPFSIQLTIAKITIYTLLMLLNLKQSHYIENNTWVRGNTRFISSVEHDISRVSVANE